MTRPISYRADIDGLRAISVTAVVAFHGFPTAAPGGFVGVDIFFVISGYLITSIILKAVNDKQFSLTAFYERRMRRLFPALFVMVAASIAIGWILLFPKEYASFGASVASAAGFVANFWFLNEANSYFADDAEFSPLLHVWSLAVEEQFYLLAPILIAATFIYAGRICTSVVLGLIFFGSLTASAIYTSTDPNLAFFSPATRAFELTLGCLLALLPPFSIGSMLRRAARWVGLVLIFGTIFFLSEKSGFPGLIALLPCTGAALIIVAGRQKTGAANLLSLKPVVFVGLISYSWYLWHWPILSYARVQIDSVVLPVPVAVICVAASFIIAVLSWRYIEQPFRGAGSIFPERKQVFAAAFAAMFTLFVAGLSIYRTDGVPMRLPEDAKLLLASKKYWNTDTNWNCQRQPTGWSRRCTYGSSAKAARLDYLIYGDSHAATLGTAIMPRLSKRGLHGLLLTMPGCLPVTNAVRLTPHGVTYDACRVHNEKTLEYIASLDDAPLIIMNAKWAAHAEGIDRRGRHYADELVWVAPDGSLPRDQFALIDDSINTTISALVDTGRAIALIGSAPDPGWDVPRQLARNAAYGSPLPPTATRLDYDPDKLGRIEQSFLQLSQSSDGISYHSIVDVLCPKDTCLVEKDGPLYADNHHLSFNGADFVAEKMIDGLLKAHQNASGRN